MVGYEVLLDLLVRFGIFLDVDFCAKNATKDADKASKVVEDKHADTRILYALGANNVGQLGIGHKSDFCLFSHFGFVLVDSMLCFDMCSEPPSFIFPVSWSFTVSVAKVLSLCTYNADRIPSQN